MRKQNLVLIPIFIFIVSCAHTTPMKSRDSLSVIPYKEVLKTQSDEERIQEAKGLGSDAITFLATEFLLKANDHSLKGHSLEAVNYYSKFLELNYDPYVESKLGVEYIRVGDLQKAKGFLANSLMHKYEESNALVFASLLSTLEDYHGASVVYERVLNDHHNDEACYYLAKTYSQMKKNKEAFQVLDRCEKNSPESPLFAYFSGRLYLEQGKGSQALKYFKKSLSKDDSYAPAVLAVGAMLEEKENYKDAIEVYRQFIDQESNENNYQVLSRLSSLLFQLEYDGKEVLPYAERLMALDNSDLNLKVRVGVLYADEGRFDEAKKLLSDVLMQVPDSDKVLFYLGTLYHQTGEYEVGINYLQKIPDTSALFAESNIQVGQMLGLLAQKDPSVGGTKLIKFVETQSDKYKQIKLDLNLILASFFEELGDIKKAIQIMLSLKKQEKYNEGHEFYLASLFEKAGSVEEAQKIVEGLLKKNPNDAQSLNFLGYTLLEKNQNLDKAFEYINKAAKLRPNDGYIRDSLAWYYYKTGNYKKALDESLKALSLVKSDIVILKHLGIIYSSLQNFDKAKEFFTYALDVARAPNERDELLKNINEIDRMRLPASVGSP